MRVAKERRIRRQARLARKREIARLIEVVGPDSWRASLVRGFPGDMRLDWLRRWSDPVYRDDDNLFLAGSASDDGPRYPDEDERAMRLDADATFRGWLEANSLDDVE